MIAGCAKMPFAAPQARAAPAHCREPGTPIGNLRAIGPTPLHHERCGERRIAQMDGHCVVHHAAQTSKHHHPSVGPIVLVQPSLHLHLPCADSGWRRSNLRATSVPPSTRA